MENEIQSRARIQEFCHIYPFFILYSLTNNLRDGKIFLLIVDIPSSLRWDDSVSNILMTGKGLFRLKFSDFGDFLTEIN